MAIVTRENERLYLKSWEYNAARIISYLAIIVENNGGRVKPTKSALISNRSITEKVSEYEERIERFKKASAITGKDASEAIKKLENEIAETKAINNEPITVTHTSYISFVLDNTYYYYQVDSNPFFEFYHIKTPVKDNKYSNDACMEEDKKDWLYDCFLKSGCSSEDIREAAHMIFNMLLSAKNSTIMRDKRKMRVSNTYDNGYHYETVYAKERIATIDF